VRPHNSQVTKALGADLDMKARPIAKSVDAPPPGWRTDVPGVLPTCGLDARKMALNPQGLRNSIAGFDLTSLQLYTSVFEDRNIARAARRNHIAASAVSRRISELEQRVGAALFFRTRHGVDASPAGRVLYRHAKRILANVELMDAELTRFSSVQRGRIRLWAHSSAVSQFLPEDLALFVDRHPDVRVDLREDNSEAIVRALLDGDADIGIFSEHADPVRLETRIYRRDTLVVAMRRGHRLSSLKSVGLEDITSCERVGLREGNSIEKKLQAASRAMKIPLSTRIEVSSFDAARRMVEAGIGIAVLPEGAVAPFLSSNDLEMVPLREEWATRTLMMGFRDYASLPVIARSFVSCLSPDAGFGKPAAPLPPRAQPSCNRSETL